MQTSEQPMEISRGQIHSQIPRYLSFTYIRDRISCSVKFSSKYIWQKQNKTKHRISLSLDLIVAFKNFCSGELEPLGEASQ